MKVSIIPVLLFTLALSQISSGQQNNFHCGGPPAKDPNENCSGACEDQEDDNPVPCCFPGNGRGDGVGAYCFCCPKRCSEVTPDQCTMSDEPEGVRLSVFQPSRFTEAAERQQNSN